MQTQKDLISFISLVKDMRHKQKQAKMSKIYEHPAIESAKAVDIWLAGHADINVKIAEIGLTKSQVNTVRKPSKNNLSFNYLAS